MLVKEKLHEVIDHIEDDQLIEGYLNLILTLNTSQSGTLYRKLTNKQKEYLNVSFDDSFEKTQLLSNQEVKKTIR